MHSYRCFRLFNNVTECYNVKKITPYRAHFQITRKVRTTSMYSKRHKGFKKVWLCVLFSIIWKCHNCEVMLILPNCQYDVG